MRRRPWSRTCWRATPKRASALSSKSGHRNGRIAEVMNHDSYSDTYIRGILNTVKSIAMVGISPKDNRPSFFAFKYLLDRGYNMIPVNPGQAGKDILGQKVYRKIGRASCRERVES